MRWGLYNDDGLRPDNEGPLVYFSGYQDPFMVGLGGSSRHVVGFYGATSTGSRSATPALVSFLLAGIETGKPPVLPSWKDEREELDDLFSAMAIANHYLRAPTQDLEFVAQVIINGDCQTLSHHAPASSMRVILGTPLYVAQVHGLAEDDPSGLIGG